MPEYIVFPSSYFNARKIDEDLQKEYESVSDSGLYKITIFGYDKWFNENRLVLTEKPDEEVSALYRGWIMQPEQYTDFYNRLRENNIKLITSPEEYAKLHIFPYIYPEIINDTAEIIVYPDGKEINLDRIKKKFRRFMVKDFVKSVKGTEFPAFFDSRDINKEEFDRHMEIFYKYRGSLYTGGICIKEFLDLKRYEGKTNEYRIFVANNQIISVCRNSLQPQYATEFPTDFIKKYTNLGSPFYTVDCAELSDGTWKIIETGDGQVSGLSCEQNYNDFFKSLYYAFS